MLINGKKDHNLDKKQESGDQLCYDDNRQAQGSPSVDDGTFAGDDSTRRITTESRSDLDVLAMDPARSFEVNRLSCEHPCRHCAVRKKNGSDRRHGVKLGTLVVAELMGFCEGVSIVGMRNLVRPANSWFRPIFWGLLILGGSAFTIYQSGDRFSFYLSWPTNVGVRVAYVDTVRFPMTTICNENRVSRSVAKSYGQ